MKRASSYSSRQGFTIVELLVVIVVIAILAAITIVAYNGMTQRARQSAATSAAESASKKVLTYAATNSDQYPSDLPTAGVNNDSNTIFEYSYDNTAKTYCITATFQKVSYFISSTNMNPSAGLCAGHNGGTIADGIIIQTVTSSNCPSTRIRAVDARDNHTYWVQKLADGKCWMLTNLAYQGGTYNGGANTYNDSRALTNGGTSYTVPTYYIPASGANVTSEPAGPSLSTDGGATSPQYGYYYNWCAAMGAPISTDANPTAACANATTPAPDTSRSICPSGWRLPTGNGGEFAALNTAINGGSTTTDAGFRSTMLAQYSGGSGGWQGSYILLWSSTQSASNEGFLYWGTSSLSNLVYHSTKTNGYAVRCLAN